jgi:hypothetical protein
MVIGPLGLNGLIAQRNAMVANERVHVNVINHPQVVVENCVKAYQINPNHAILNHAQEMSVQMVKCSAIARMHAVHYVPR